MLLEADQVVPMHRDLVSVEQPRLGQHETAVLDAAELDAEAGEALQPLEHAPLARSAVGLEAREHEYRLGARAARREDRRRP